MKAREVVLGVVLAVAGTRAGVWSVGRACGWGWVRGYVGARMRWCLGVWVGWGCVGLRGVGCMEGAWVNRWMGGRNAWWV